MSSTLRFASPAFLAIAVTTSALAQTTADPRGPRADLELTITPFAHAEQVGHPISLDVDSAGRVYVAETHRYTLGVRQSRGDRKLEDAELRAATVDDFKEVLLAELAAGKFRRAPETDRVDPEYAFYADLADEVVVYEDTDGDGVADARRVFAGGFDDWYSGPGADVLVDGGRLYLHQHPRPLVGSPEDADWRTASSATRKRTRLPHRLRRGLLVPRPRHARSRARSGWTRLLVDRRSLVPCHQRPRGGAGRQDGGPCSA